MNYSQIALNQIAVMFVIVFVGYIAKKTKLLNQNASKGMTDVLLNIVTPILIINSYQIEYTKEKIGYLLMAFLLSIISLVVVFIVAHFIKSKDKEVEKISIILSNSGFMGIPLINAMFGSIGVFYLTAYLSVFNVVIWSYGVKTMNSSSNLNFKKILFSPNIISIFVGLLLFIFQIKFPSIIATPMELISNLNTPLAMLVAGITLANASILNAFKNKRVYLIAFLRLLVAPMITLLLFKVLNFPREVSLVILTAAACPSAVICTIFSVEFKKNAKLAVEIFTLTTLASAITLPFIISLY